MPTERSLPLIARQIPSRVAASLLIFALPSCGPGEEGSDASDKVVSAAERDRIEAENLDELRGLGYVGFSESEGGEDGVVTYKKERVHPGYRLVVAPMLSTAHLIDEEGRLVHVWDDPSDEKRSWTNAEILPDGDLLVPGRLLKGEARSGDLPIDGAETDSRRFLLRLSWNGEVRFRTMFKAHHDSEQTPDGNLIVLSAERRLIEAVDSELETRDNLLVRLTPEGVEIERASLYDIVADCPDVFPLSDVRAKKDAANIDLFHCNSVEWMSRADLFDRHPLYDADHVLVSSRHQDRVFIVDWETKTVVWAWGSDELSGPHDATLLASGNILIFDNGLGRDWSRIVEVDPTSDEIVWEFSAPRRDDFYSKSRGSAQRLANGNTLVANSGRGEAFEVTAKGSLVWRFFSPLKNDKDQRSALVRAKLYERPFIEALLEQND